MANQDAAFGLRPLKMSGQGDDSTGMTSHFIDAGDASVIYQGSPVIAAAGYVDIATAGAVPNMGAFWGCFYTDPTTLKPTFKNYYPGSITPPSSKDIEAFVYDNPNQMFEIQSDNTGASAQADVFSNADMVNFGGSTTNGVSNTELDDSTIAASSDAAAQLLIIGVSRDPKNNDLTAANVNWRVIVNMHLFGHGVGTVGAG
tara:strand:- start:42 stop:644 length:603 start_codon:yes stop_codon:yes gene_type:complete